MISRRVSVRFLSSLNYKVLNKSVLVKSGVDCREMHLVPDKTLINGKWIAATDNKLLAVLNPANGQNVGNVPDMGVADTQTAIEAANTAFHSVQWNGLTAKDRSNLLKVISINTTLSIGYITHIIRVRK